MSCRTAIAERRDKMGFPVPLRNGLPANCATSSRIPSAAAMRRQRPFLNVDAVLANFESAGGFSRKVWGLLSLELWHQIFHDRAADYRRMLAEARPPEASLDRWRGAITVDRESGVKPVMKVFVTGGSGLVGSTVIDLLLAGGDEIVAIDNFATGRRDNLKPHPRLRLIEDSIVDRRVVDALIGDFRPDVVVHTAASYKDPDDWQSRRPDQLRRQRQYRASLQGP